MSIFKEGSLNLLLNFFQYTSIQKIMKILVNKISFTKQKPPKTLDNLIIWVDRPVQWPLQRLFIS